MKNMILLPLLMLISLATTAQDFLTVDDLKKRSQNTYREAQGHFRAQHLEEAEKDLTDLINDHPNFIDALLLRAALYAETDKYEAAENDFETALGLSESYYGLLTFHLARTELEQKKYSEGIEHLEIFLQQPGLRPNRQANAERLLKEARTGQTFYENPVPFEPRSIGENINTPGKEYLPSFNAKGDLLIYTVRRGNQEDFFVSRPDSDGQWSIGEPLEEVNTSQNEGAQSIAADGKTLVFTACHRRDGQGGCDLYIATYQHEKWTAAKNMGEVINGASWDTQPALSADGQQLFFTSNRKGGLGGDDIWMSNQQSNGKWTEPVNVGPPINSPGHEGSPFLHADGQTLYFMSDGHPGLGHTDLFIARKNETGQWQEPKNLGYPINTPNAEGAMVVSLDGQTAYFTTDKNTVEGEPQNLDIYYFDLYEDAQPQQVTYVEGKVLDATTNYPLAKAAVEITSPGYFHQLTTDRDGAFLLVLPIGQDYAFHANKENYLFFSERFELPENTDITQPFQLEIKLNPIDASLATKETGTPIVLKNVLFELGSAELLPASYDELDRLSNLLVSHSDLQIQVNGHTDDIGEETANIELSEARAEAVYNYLTGKDISPDRLRFKGFGETKPIVPNDSPENRSLNRRTEFEVITK